MKIALKAKEQECIKTLNEVADMFLEIGFKKQAA